MSRNVERFFLIVIIAALIGTLIVREQDRHAAAQPRQEASGGPQLPALKRDGSVRWADDPSPWPGR